MTDFHTHILPGIDDGSYSIEETERLLQSEHEQGVDRIVFTPHFYASEMSVRSFFENRDRAYQEVLEKLEISKEFSNLCLGAEVYYFPGMSKADILEDLCIRGTDVILIEMPFVQWTEEMYKEIRYIIDKRELTVVLAHVERYLEFQKKKKVWDMILNLPLHIQINAGPIIDRKKRKIIFKYLKNDNLVLLGSDTHDSRVRKPNLKEAREVLQEKFGEQILKDIDSYSEEILENHRTEI